MLQTDPTLMKLLTEAERQILRMLTLGHTAKTIASLQKISVNVVNERLREARRKTGASSSRTLARTLSETDQKNCPEQIGMAIDLEMGREVPAVGSVSTASRLSSKVKWFMTLLLALAATYAVFSATHQNPKTDIIQGVSNAPVAIKMQKQLENETEDALWSVNARQVLGSAYKELEGIEIVAV